MAFADRWRGDSCAFRRAQDPGSDEGTRTGSPRIQGGHARRSTASADEPASYSSCGSYAAFGSGRGKEVTRVEATNSTIDFITAARRSPFFFAFRIALA